MLSCHEINSHEKYLIGRSYKNDEFDWPFDLVIVTWKNNPEFITAAET